MSRKTILAGADILHRHGLKFRIENMIGLPGESVDQMIDTIDLNARCRPTCGWAAIFQPYPKLPLSEYAQRLDLWDGSVADFSESFFERTVLKTPWRKEIVNIQRLFGLAVGWKIVRRLIARLIRLPNNPIYSRAGAWWKSRQFGKLYAEAYR
jgi:radical SAM superfamily enzyme YgiQ (UPF0313 family)